LAALKTLRGDPDLQGIWMEETDTPLQRLPDLRTTNILHDITNRFETGKLVS
jgi:hypothetical protein